MNIEMDEADRGYQELKTLMEGNYAEESIAMVERAYHVARKAHGVQTRRSGQPYIIHPVAVAVILAHMGMDAESLTAAMLHDVAEDTPVTIAEIEEEFGKDVALLVDGVTKLGKIKLRTKEEEQAENLRKMLIAMSQDIRVIIIKLADRLHNMRTLRFMPEQKQRDKALETIEIYAPIAHRLGIRPVKEELEGPRSTGASRAFTAFTAKCSCRASRAHLTRSMTFTPCASSSTP